MSDIEKTRSQSDLVEKEEEILTLKKQLSIKGSI
jgi:hypothetical protein